MMRRYVILLGCATLLLLAAVPVLNRIVRAQPAAPQTGITFTLQPRAEARSPFRALDVYVDAGADRLAAYQFEFSAGKGAGELTLVGIEGGDAAAFKEPPRYDPRALAAPTPRVIVAAFDTGNDLPTGRTRVARLMVRVAPGAAAVEYEAHLTVAASLDGKPIAGATLQIREGALP
jgi:hypothetical protein